jgi:hypothetical protein
MFKTWIMKKMMKSQMSKLPADQRALFEKLIENNPELLMKIAEELQKEMKSGKNQMAAMMVVMKKYEKELRAALGQ